MLKRHLGALALGVAAVALAGASVVVAAGNETYPNPQPDERFECQLDGFDEVGYEPQVATVDGFTRFFTHGGDSFTKAMVRRVYDNVEFRLRAGDVSPLPEVVYVSGRQLIVLEWAAPQFVGEEPSEDLVSMLIQVPGMEIRDEDGGLVDEFRYLARFDPADGWTVPHQSGFCGDFRDT